MPNGEEMAAHSGKLMKTVEAATGLNGPNELKKNKEINSERLGFYYR